MAAEERQGGPGGFGGAGAVAGKLDLEGPREADLSDRAGDGVKVHLPLAEGHVVVDARPVVVQLEHHEVAGVRPDESGGIPLPSRQAVAHVEREPEGLVIDGSLHLGPVGRALDGHARLGLEPDAHVSARGVVAGRFSLMSSA